MMQERDRRRDNDSESVVVDLVQPLAA